KLDVLEAALAEPGKAETSRLDELADAVAEAMADYLLKLPPRTLVMMFGDHGFLLDPVVGGTSAGRSGGASPEEVLVPAFAWLVGAGRRPSAGVGAGPGSSANPGAAHGGGGGRAIRRPPGPLPAAEPRATPERRLHRGDPLGRSRAVDPPESSERRGDLPIRDR